jgi:dolichyl-diphosphooligosaccharide--protein glycosyltransferase
MIRLVLLLAPSACIAASILMACLFEWVFNVLDGTDNDEEEVVPAKKKGKIVKQGQGKSLAQTANDKIAEVNREFKKYNTARMAVAFIVFLFMLFLLRNFHGHSFMMAQRLSEPQIILRGRGRDGQPIIVNDFIEAYHWLRDNTPEDSRVLSWWDYGYQINGVANRTSIADGNTWNHEHIALLGRVLISPEREAHKIARHLADYVLVWSTRWAGMMGDDLAKCPHMARIAGSVFFDIQFHDYYMMSSTQPSPALGKSLLYQLHGYRLNPDIPKPQYFDEVYTTQNRMVRIFKVKNVSEESKKYAAEHHTYPPALDSILAQSNSFQRDREHQFLNM